MSFGGLISCYITSKIDEKIFELSNIANVITHIDKIDSFMHPLHFFSADGSNKQHFGKTQFLVFSTGGRYQNSIEILCKRITSSMIYEK